MKKFETLNHTADVAGRVYGRNRRELFVNASELLYSLMSPEFCAGRAAETRIGLSGDNTENLLVRFLNELIYYAEVKKTAGSVLRFRIGCREGRLFLECRMKSRRIKRQGREIKAATYHGLRVEKKKGVLTASVIFDI